MSLKKATLLGLISAIFSIQLSLLFNQIYSKGLDVNFSKVLTYTGIVIANLIGCFLMAIGYYIIIKFDRLRLLAFFNILIVVVSFISIIGVFGFQLPMEIEYPELFPGLAIPMHFFPCISYLSLIPFFKKKNYGILN